MDLAKLIKSANVTPVASGYYSGLKITILQNKELCDIIDMKPPKTSYFH